MVCLRRDLSIGAIWVLLPIFLTLASCGTQVVTSPPPESVILIVTQGGASELATQVVALTQEKNNADNQAVASAEIVRANAQATLDSANATLRAVQTQDQNNSNVIAAQIAATAAIVRANAQATLSSAGATQNAAMTQDAIRQTEMADQSTSGAAAIINQQNIDELAANTQTAVANNIATQTQIAVATTQWYTDQARQRSEQRQGPIAFLWMWCFPIFIVIFAGLCLWGFWRWLKIKQKRQRYAKQPIENLEASVDLGEPQDRLLHSGDDIVNGQYQVTKPDDQVNRWLAEVKSKLLSSDKKDEDDNTGN